MKKKLNVKNFQQTLKGIVKKAWKKYPLKLVKDLPAKGSMSVTLNSAGGPMLEHVKEVVGALEKDHRITTRQGAISGLRQLGLDDFGLVLLSMPDSEYPKISRLLPAMASDEVQRNWTGDHGLALLQHTTGFVRALSYHFTSVTGRHLHDSSVLDFGCGYGRIARLLYYFTAQENIFGVDPWDQAIKLCQESRLGTNFLVSDYLPAILPFGEKKFDLIYAFSVFTHLSHRAMTTSLSTLRKYIADDGILVITIRPVEFWKAAPHMSPDQKDALAVRHRQEGFAFHPHNREPIDGDVTYGESSMTVDWMAVTFPDWTIKATDRCLNDVFQRYVIMVPR